MGSVRTTTKNPLIQQLINQARLGFQANMKDSLQAIVDTSITQIRDSDARIQRLIEDGKNKS